MIPFWLLTILHYLSLVSAVETPNDDTLVVRLSQILLAISPEAGAKTPLYLACAPELANSSGKYYEKSKAVTSSPESLDREAQERLWQISTELTARIC